MEEIWKDIPGYEGEYEASNLGRVKSCERTMIHHNWKTPMIWKEKILKPCLGKQGYYTVRLYGKTKLLHQIIAITFLGHIPSGRGGVQIDHINSIKTDNRVDNLRVVSHRFNSTKDVILKSKSKYPGVIKIILNSGNIRWRSVIQIDGKSKYLGQFKTEIEAAEAYQTALKKI
jgi:hypothetical protein